MQLFTTKYDLSIRMWQAFSERYVNMFKDILRVFFVLFVHCKVYKGNTTIFFLIRKMYAEIDTLVIFCTFSIFKMATKYDVKRFKVIEYMRSYTIILFQLEAYSKYLYKN